MIFSKYTTCIATLLILSVSFLNAQELTIERNVQEAIDKEFLLISHSQANLNQKDLELILKNQSESLKDWQIPKTIEAIPENISTILPNVNEIILATFKNYYSVKESKKLKNSEVQKPQILLSRKWSTSTFKSMIDQLQQSCFNEISQQKFDQALEIANKGTQIFRQNLKFSLCKIQSILKNDAASETQIKSIFIDLPEKMTDEFKFCQMIAHLKLNEFTTANLLLKEISDPTQLNEIEQKILKEIQPLLAEGKYKKIYFSTPEANQDLNIQLISDQKIKSVETPEDLLRAQAIANINQETKNWYRCAVKVPTTAYSEPKVVEDAHDKYLVYKIDELKCEPLTKDKQKWQRVLLFPSQKERMIIQNIESVYLKNLDIVEQSNETKSVKTNFIMIAIAVIALILITLWIKDRKKNA